MPRERRPPKRFRTSTDSDRESESSGRGLSQPLSPTKRQKRTPPQTLSSVTPPNPKEENIIICNPFDDSPLPNFSQFPKMNPQRLGPYTNINSFQQPSQQPNYPRVDNGSLQSVMYHPNMTRQSSYPCGICQSEVHDSDTAIMCEGGCEYWFHRVCTGLTETAFNLLRKEELAVWCCDNCIRQKKIPMVMLKSQPVS
ncbi:pygopus homolog 1-like [Anneissia japonica]|uniref:pygopus homolog 1-like n=1 Tax=Anneissia japonica TaxID=1529436 RepID=UPI0014256419|nr:pygopus homolog 1-like [Anneissia japonica]